MFLFQDILFSIYCWFINIELSTNNAITHAWMRIFFFSKWDLSNLYFLYKAHHSALVLRSGTHRQHFSILLGPFYFIFPILNPPCPPPSPSHPSGSSQCTSPEHLSHASNLGWWSVSPLIVYLFQCCSLRSSHLAFSHRVQKSVLYICVSFSVLHIGLSLPSF